jgi:ubiquinone/menaquinone biosynthesis C-methylase UbiE
MGLFKKYVNQTRKPEGFLGKMMVDSMNGGHAKLSDWGLSHLRVSPKTIAELGCGGGRNAAELMQRYPQAKLTALDYSPVSVEKAKALNAAVIEAGRCTVLQGNVASLPMEDASFELATAFETVYFWPGLPTCFAEVYRVLKPGGVFLICNESDGTDKTGLRFEKIIDGMKCYTAEEIEAALRAAGFSEVHADSHPDKPWLTVVGRK